MGKLIVVVGGQFGSEGKGAAAAWLSAQEPDLLALRAGGSQAGHTAYDENGTAWPLRHVPVAAVVNKNAMLGIAQGSEIDMTVLRSEIEELDAAGFDVSGRLTVDPTATIITDEHRAQEREHQPFGPDGNLEDRLGSTCKGVGAARAARMWRTASTYGDETSRPVEAVHQQTLARHYLKDGGTVLIEAAQGYGLGLHAGHYPFCTSSDCTAIDAMSAAGLSPWDGGVAELEIWVVFRPFPIRVAGNSGPLKHETSWEALAADFGGHIKPEKTTVTRKIRRVGLWDSDLAIRAMLANGSGPVSPSPNVRIAAMFGDYLAPEVSGLDGVPLQDWAPPAKLGNWIRRVESDTGQRVSAIGTGPRTMLDLRTVR